MNIKYIDVDNHNVVENFNAKFKNGKWVVLYYANWCGHCKNFMPEWDKYKTTNNLPVKCASVESSVMDKLQSKPNIDGFPTIKMYDNMQEIAQFDGERTATSLKSFVDNILSSRDNNLPYYSKKNNSDDANIMHINVKNVRKTKKTKNTKKAKTTKKTKKINKVKKTKKVKNTRKHTKLHKLKGGCMKQNNNDNLYSLFPNYA